jgi:hypothetical protein
MRFSGWPLSHSPRGKTHQWAFLESCVAASRPYQLLPFISLIIGPDGTVGRFDGSPKLKRFERGSYTCGGSEICAIVMNINDGLPTLREV